MNYQARPSLAVTSGTTILSIDFMDRSTSSRSETFSTALPGSAKSNVESEPTFRESARKLQSLDYRGTLLLIEMLKSLWSSHGSDPCITRCFVDAFEFLGALPVGIPAPAIWTDGECEVVFEWIGKRDHAIVSLEGDGFLGYTFREEGAFRPGECVSAVPSIMPGDLESYLRSFE